MGFSKVVLGAMGYELAPMVVRSAEIEARLAPAYDRLRIPSGQLEAMTGIRERRWWPVDHAVSEGAARAAADALDRAELPASAIDQLTYASVCREGYEPATACHVAHRLAQSGLRLPERCIMYDLGNACLGVINAALDIANRIELGQIRHGLIVACESAREINDIAIRRLNAGGDMRAFTLTAATLTGGSGAAALILSSREHSDAGRPSLRAVTGRSAPQHRGLCRWWTQRRAPESDGSSSQLHEEFMATDPVELLKHGVELGVSTFRAFSSELGWAPSEFDRTICHQVGRKHRDMVLAQMGIPLDRDFASFETLGNTGSAALPMTLGLADDRGLMKSGDRVGLLGIGSGLSCMMMGVEW